MEITCPSCGKSNQASPCARCGCELGTLFDLHHAAGEALALAAYFLRLKEAGEAFAQASRSWNLRHTAQAARIAFLACIAAADHSEALKWRARC